MSDTQTTGTRLMGREAYERARNLRDLTDPAAGAHAMQRLLDRMRETLGGAWQCEVLVHRDDAVVMIADNYDHLGYPPGAVARDARYARYVTQATLLRTHTSAMIPPLLRALARSPSPPADLLLVCPGLVYRRDTIDRLHTGEPHQVDLWRVRRGRPLITRDLEHMVALLLEALLPGRSYRCIPASHPYTIHGLQVDAQVSGEWVEICECGVASPALLAASGLDPSHWSGLALGAGLDRLLMLVKGMDDIRLLRSEDPRIASQMLDLEPYRPVSNQPPIRRDLSVAVAPDLTPEEIGDRVRVAMADVNSSLEAVEVLNETSYEDLPEPARQRIGMRPGQKNVLLRVTIRDLERTLRSEEANELRNRVYKAVHEGEEYQWA
jgi:phenylalanyl-tRNA synthetase alpha chain